jgi:hypothetical protein
MNTVEFGSKAEADAFRDEHANAVAEGDDRRLKTVALVEDAPQRVLDEAAVRAGAGRADRGGRGGQIELTDVEKERVGPFDGSNNYRKAAAVKGLMRDAGVDDWSSFYDPMLSVDEHREIAERAAREEGGQRMDAETDVDEHLADVESAMGEQCDHARDHCRHGEPEACEFLQESCGFDEEQVEEILTNDDQPESSDDQQITGAAAGALRRAWQGYSAGSNRAISEIADAQEAVANAAEAIEAINAIRQANGQEPITEWDNLQEARALLRDLDDSLSDYCGCEH